MTYSAIKKLISGLLMILTLCPLPLASLMAQTTGIQIMSPEALSAGNLEYFDTQEADHPDALPKNADLSAQKTPFQKAASLLFAVNVSDHPQNIRRFSGTQLHVNFGAHIVVVPVQEKILLTRFNGTNHSYQSYEERGQHKSMDFTGGLVFYPVNTSAFKAGVGSKGAVGYLSDGQRSYRFEGYGRVEAGFKGIRIFSEYGRGFHHFENATRLTISTQHLDVRTAQLEDVTLTIRGKALVKQHYHRFVLGANIKSRVHEVDNNAFFISDIDFYYSKMLIPDVSPFTGNAVAQGIGFNLHRNNRFSFSLEYYFDFPVLVASEKKIASAGMFSASFSRSLDWFWDQ